MTKKNDESINEKQRRGKDKTKGGLNKIGKGASRLSSGSFDFDDSGEFDVGSGFSGSDHDDDDD